MNICNEKLLNVAKCQVYGFPIRKGSKNTPPSTHIKVKKKHFYINKNTLLEISPNKPLTENLLGTFAISLDYSKVNSRSTNSIAIDNMS